VRRETPCGRQLHAGTESTRIRQTPGRRSECGTFPPRTFAVATNPAKRAFKLALRRLLETHYRQLGDSDVISIPAGFRRHLVGKTLINVSHCDIAEIRFVGKLVIIQTFS